MTRPWRWTNSNSGGRGCQTIVEKAGRLTCDLPHPKASGTVAEFAHVSYELSELEGTYEHPDWVRLAIRAAPPSALRLGLEGADGKVAEADARAHVGGIRDRGGRVRWGQAQLPPGADTGRVESIRLGQ